MSVLDRFPRPISTTQRVYALQLLTDRAVEVRPDGAGRAAGLVRDDTGTHRTTLIWRDGQRFAYTCDCAIHHDGGVCPHVVATALAAQVAGLVQDGEQDPSPTEPRKSVGPTTWLSATGQLRRMDVDEPRPMVRHQPSPPSWRKLLDRVKAQAALGAAPAFGWPAEREMLYIIDIGRSAEGRSLLIQLACRDRKSNGQWSKPKFRGLSYPPIALLPNADDRRIVALLRASGDSPFVPSYDPVYSVPPAMRVDLMEHICRTGRAIIRPDNEVDDWRPLQWDEAGAWHLVLHARREESLGRYVFMGMLRRGQEQLPLARPTLVLAGGLVFIKDTVAPLEDNAAADWIGLLRSHRSIFVPFAQSDELLIELLSIPNLPKLDLPPDLDVQMLRIAPRPRLHIRAPRPNEARPDRLRAALAFDYDGLIVAANMQSGPGIFERQRRRLVMRNEQAERAAHARLRELGLRETFDDTSASAYWFNRRHLARLVNALLHDGWHVEADGRTYRRAGTMRLNVRSGIDWFELRGDIDFGGRSAKLPDLLAAIRRGERVVQLDDGTIGMLPEDWLNQYELLAGFGEDQGEFLKFVPTQVGLLDALLAAQPEATFDQQFARTRDAVHSFDGIVPIDAPPGFVGELRHYQRDGLGWFDFLRQFGFGGCLADDMGLGKTIQVLALLESRSGSAAVPGRTSADAGEDARAPSRPSLVVVPRSLVFNWEQEAARFTPNLRVLDHTGIDRIRSTEHLVDYDLVITTYGTLRRDAAFLKDMEFDYVVLDEAQAVKNPASESAKAVRLVRGRHRLALSGTPVQNHLGDLWSLFEFLNPGMLGNASVFIGTGAMARNPDPQTRTLLSRALRPFILRRTKEQVASELPPRLEQTIYCQLEEQQRRLYDELREHYRRSILAEVDKHGIARSRFQILEALLRLRQAALHPGLIDKSRAAESSAKLDMLLPQLDEVTDEGHKALVFSQFTSMLAIVRNRLDEQKTVYEYLDGQTKDRQHRVERFQTDPNCKLFLISLKAGGLGLNLTAADYVFLLDPWWNPAVEQQAIDRTHRIGQTRQVYACRLIAKDTVEEKVLALQQSKRDLADAIITADNSILRTIGREELELLLS